MPEPFRKQFRETLQANLVAKLRAGGIHNLDVRVYDQAGELKVEIDGEQKEIDIGKSILRDYHGLIRWNGDGKK